MSTAFLLFGEVITDKHDAQNECGGCEEVMRCSIENLLR